MARRTDRTRRTDAQRRARDARAQRESAWQARQKQLEAALTDYFTAAAAVDRIRADAQAKADAVLASAETAASKPYAAACAAVLRLRQLVGSNAELAGMCGIRPDEVSEMLAHARPQAQDESPPADATVRLAGTADGATAVTPGESIITELPVGTPDSGPAASDDSGRR